MTHDDVLFRHHQRCSLVPAKVGVSQACREHGYHRSTSYPWRRMVERQGLEMLRPRERRRPPEAQPGPTLAGERVVAFARGHPGLGPRRISAQLGLSEWGGQPISANGVYKTLRRHGLNTRIRRLSLIAGYASPPVPEPQLPPKRLHLEAELPGDLVQFDCFHIGRLTGTKGRVWQYCETVLGPNPLG